MNTVKTLRLNSSCWKKNRAKYLQCNNEQQKIITIIIRNYWRQKVHTLYSQKTE